MHDSTARKASQAATMLLFAFLSALSAVATAVAPLLIHA
jgi:hypothetical protein